MTDIEPDLKIGRFTGGDRLVAQLRGSLTAEIVETLNRSSFEGLDIGPGSFPDLEPLVDVRRKIKRLSIRAVSIDWKALNNLEAVESMYLDGENYEGLDFASFPNLKHLELHTNTKYKNILMTSRSLEALKIIGCGKESLDFFGELPSLRYLLVAGARKLESLDGLDRAHNLCYLELERNPKLLDISRMSSCKKLKYLKISYCKNIKNIKSILNVHTLEELRFDAKLDSLAFLKKLKKLKILRFSCDVDDGDLSFLYEMDSLRSVAFNNKRNYSVKLAEIHQHLESKGYVQNGTEQNMHGFPSGWSLVS
ncbi:MAG: hypothetical protein JKY67_00650 [Pseudomonadales bacterium]|nr:hypothetical protein [Pseudomonadales bacterium]MBL4864867.1 hypothetical protein [Pseudomonadales bacterium]